MNNKALISIPVEVNYIDDASSPYLGEYERNLLNESVIVTMDFPTCTLGTLSFFIKNGQIEITDKRYIRVRELISREILKPNQIPISLIEIMVRQTVDKYLPSDLSSYLKLNIILSHNGHIQDIKGNS